ncbi:MAG: hypothetical protein K0S26_2429 [Bacteroidota bacterium]|nr:hypothetical protein [Bacteroidota bacterium]
MKFLKGEVLNNLDFRVFWLDGLKNGKRLFLF